MNHPRVTVLLLVPATIIVALAVCLEWPRSTFMVVLCGYCVLVFGIQVYRQSEPETGQQPRPVLQTVSKLESRSLWSELRRRHLYGDQTDEMGLGLVVLLVILGYVLLLSISGLNYALEYLAGLFIVGSAVMIAFDRLGIARRRFLEREAAALNDPVQAARIANELGRYYRQGERLPGALALLALAYARLERYHDAERVGREALAAAEHQAIRAVTPTLDNPVTIARRALDEARYRTGYHAPQTATSTPPSGLRQYASLGTAALLVTGALLIFLITTFDAITALLLLVVIAVPVLFVVWRWIVPMVRLNRPATLLTRIQSGDQLAVLSETIGQWRAGKQTPANAMLVAMAYLHDHNPAEAEPFARQAREMIYARGLHKRRDLFARWLAENAALALYNARLHQGRYAEAADALRERLPFTAYPAATLALTIWALFLGEDMDNAKTLIAQLHMQNAQHDFIPEPYQLALLYVQHKLSGMEQPSTHSIREGLSFWREEVDRYAGTPYGERLRSAFDEMELLAES